MYYAFCLPHGHNFIRTNRVQEKCVAVNTGVECLMIFDYQTEDYSVFNSS